MSSRQRTANARVPAVRAPQEPDDLALPEPEDTNNFHDDPRQYAWEEDETYNGNIEVEVNVDSVDFGHNNTVDDDHETWEDEPSSDVLEEIEEELAKPIIVEDWVDDPVRMYLREIGRVDLLEPY